MTRIRNAPRGGQDVRFIRCDECQGQGYGPPEWVRMNTKACLPCSHCEGQGSLLVIPGGDVVTITGSWSGDGTRS